MQLEGTAAGATALFEMLVHTHGGITKVFPATPAVWTDASFHGVPQAGGFRISAIRGKGKTQAIKITSLRGGQIVLDVPDRKSMRLLRNDQDSVAVFPLKLSMAAGETVSFIADGKAPLSFGPQSTVV
jgi:hypothetical protein